VLEKSNANEHERLILNQEIAYSKLISLLKLIKILFVMHGRVNGNIKSQKNSPNVKGKGEFHANTLKTLK
jgi:hypothetical protein